MAPWASTPTWTFISLLASATRLLKFLLKPTACLSADWATCWSYRPSLQTSTDGQSTLGVVPLSPLPSQLGNTSLSTGWLQAEFKPMLGQGCWPSQAMSIRAKYLKWGRWESPLLFATWTCGSETILKGCHRTRTDEWKFQRVINESYRFQDSMSIDRNPSRILCMLYFSHRSKHCGGLVHFRNSATLSASYYLSSFSLGQWQ